VAEKSLKRKYPEAIGEKLGITGENVIQRAHRDAEYRRQQKDKTRKRTSDYEKRRKIRKILNASKVAKEEKKSERYRSGKVPLASVGTKSKSNGEPAKKRKRKCVCSNCGVDGHTINLCPQPGGKGKVKKPVAPKKNAKGKNDMDFLDFL
jgi:hypothetical protein